MSESRSKDIKFYQFHTGEWKLTEGKIIIERVVSLIVNGKVWMDMLCTPNQLDHLAVGFLFNEGLIRSKDDLANVHVCQSDDYVEVKTNNELSQPTYWRTTTGCSGGRTSLSLPQLPEPNLHDIQLSSQSISDLLQKFLSAQQQYLEARGVHTSALSDGKEIIALAEDIGRHNTLDKLAGYCLLNQILLPQPIIITTGRISSEMLQKSARMGTSVIISLTSPNNYSIELADYWGITLVGYARASSFNVYTHPKRIMSRDTILRLDNKLA